jgi:hypothetical protein
MIYTVFGKKGSGKSTLSKEIMVNLGGRVVFLSPVERLNVEHVEVWTVEDIETEMEEQEPGDVVLVRLADVSAMDAVACQAIYDGEGYTIIIDEVEKYQGSKELLDMIHYSRHFNIHIVANTRRYVDVPRLLTSQSDILYVAPTREPRDIQYIKDYTEPAFVEALNDLETFEFLEYPSCQVRKTKNLDF